MHAASGVLLVDRHIEKNGGTSFRSVLTQAERAGHCMYWGFSQNSAAWNSTVHALLRLSPEAPPPRLCIEAHSYIDYGIPWRRRLRQLVALRRVWRERSVPMKMLLTVRFRSPLDYYLSFFTWIVAARQARDGRRFGHNFSQWVAVSPNLQAEILLYSRSANTAAYCPLVHEERTAWAARWRGGDHNATARAAAAWRSLRSYDVVGTTERFDESALLVLRRLGWGEEAPPTSVALSAAATVQPGCMRGEPATESNWWCYLRGASRRDERRRILRRVCPDMGECAALMRRYAPADAGCSDYEGKWAHAAEQNFSSPRACFVADQAVMGPVWRQHGQLEPAGVSRAAARTRAEPACSGPL
ncbi:hypothetical protein EMIHUDRAFT_452242 [Emiliania huxleyi CCMP1516]|uniref:Uncharacterized protein n=2 Tax=Emiliania huxleyi TaxID=2903 RepID=A0A0D3ILC4_EMIH1|nr:hypothetical protein EMIHUDRAFT_452242 [Emiliania huxleyi CCMP1516]EOD12059.1 hypothetical protein EMIHUDRAFT_452242 [Emiliania huxleyi CCMP1516]|eukprot:XP_005764488.1 hypothetical protein EMIHUDRAFT_452242 [Emiliania huxleyi CCMP1516]